MSNLAFFNLTNYIRERVQDASLVKKTASIALGIALSRSCPLPSMEQEHAESHYVELVAVLIAQKATEFNEQCLVDIDLACQTARAYWLIRYYNAYPVATLMLPDSPTDHFMSAVNGIGHLINPETFEFCQKNSRAMIAVINRVREITDTMF